MDDPEFRECVGAAVGLGMGVAARLGIAPADLANVAAAALEVIAACIGKAQAVERLRNVADIAERELLTANNRGPALH